MTVMFQGSDQSMKIQTIAQFAPLFDKVKTKLQKAIQGLAWRAVFSKIDSSSNGRSFPGVYREGKPIVNVTFLPSGDGDVSRLRPKYENSDNSAVCSTI